MQYMPPHRLFAEVFRHPGMPENGFDYSGGSDIMEAEQARG